MSLCNLPPTFCFISFFNGTQPVKYYFSPYKQTGFFSLQRVNPASLFALAIRKLTENFCSLSL